MLTCSTYDSERTVPTHLQYATNGEIRGGRAQRVFDVCLCAKQEGSQMIHSFGMQVMSVKLVSG